LITCRPSSLTQPQGRLQTLATHFLGVFDTAALHLAFGIAFVT
jgi:hypothetical protein